MRWSEDELQQATARQHPKKMRKPKGPALDCCEADLQAAIHRLMRRGGWKHYHTHDSRRSQPGFPDIVAIRAPRIIFAELKTETGKPTQEQAAWLEELCRIPAVECYVWRPSDWDRIWETLKR